MVNLLLVSGAYRPPRPPRQHLEGREPRMDFFTLSFLLFTDVRNSFTVYATRRGGRTAEIALTSPSSKIQSWHPLEGSVRTE